MQIFLNDLSHSILLLGGLYYLGKFGYNLQESIKVDSTVIFFALRIQ